MNSDYYDDEEEYTCPVGTTLKLVGGKYKALILWRLTGATLRSGKLQQLIPQASARVLTQQLRELERDNLVMRKVHPAVPPKVEYSLTPLGRSIHPVLTAMYEWGLGYLESSGVEANCSMVED